MAIRYECGYFQEYIKYKQMLDDLERRGESESKPAQKLRNTLISYWNKMPPHEQREIAELYIIEKT